MAITSQGAQIYFLDHNDTGNEVIEFGCATTIGSASPTRNKIDVTCLTSTAKEFLLGLVDNGSFDVGFRYDPQSVGYAKARALEGGDAVRVVIGLSESSDDPVFTGGTVYTLPTTRTWISFDALIEAVSRGDITIDDAMNGTMTLTVSGAETETKKV